MVWTGCPANYPIGDENTEASIIYTAKRTLLVSGNSPSHGAHVLVAPTWCTRDIVLDDNTTKSVMLDGSFIACATMGKTNGFSSPSGTLLYDTLAGVFTDMETFEDAEVIALLKAQALVLSDQGAGVFRYEDHKTTDSSSFAASIISGTKQDHYVIRTITQQAGARLTGFVPPDPFAAIALIRGFVVELIAGMISLGHIAPYGGETEPPTRRDINPQTDIQVFRDATVKTDFFYRFFYNRRYPIERVSGLFGVDSNEILKGVARTV